MSTELPDIGGVPTSVEPGLRRFLLSLREHVRELRGNTGDPAGAATAGGTNTTIVIGDGGGGDGEVSPPDLTPPPTPSGVSLVAGFDFVGIVTNEPAFTQGHGYGRTKVYGAKYAGTGPLPTFASAVLVHEFVGEVGSFPSPPNTQWHVWLKWRTIDGVDSVVPSGGTTGDSVTTGADIALLLAALTGQIDVSQLSSSLAATISTLQADVAALNSTPAWDIGTTYPTDSVVTYAGKLYKARRVTVGDQPDISTLDWEKIGDYDTLAGVVAAHTVSIADHESRITSNASGLAAEVSARTALAATVGTNTAAIATEAVTRAAVDSANASAISTVAAIVNNPVSGVAANYAAINVEASARAAADTTLFARYAVKLDVNGYVVGWELNNNGSSGSLNVLANAFTVGAPGRPDITPFIVRTTTTTENGVTIPAGVYMDAAYIVNLSAMIAKFGNAAISSAQIQSLAATKITSGAITVGAVIQSSNYIANNAGWAIRGDGTVEIQQLIARGNIYADDGYFRGDVSGARGTFQGGVRGGAFAGYAWPATDAGGGYYLGAGGLLLGNYNTYVAGHGGGYFQVTADGNVYGPNFQIVNGNLTINGNGTFSGALNAATGTFSGALNAATGTFSGTLTAFAINAVDTINIRGEAVIAPRLVLNSGPVTIPRSSTRTSIATAATINIPSLPGRISDVSIQIFFDTFKDDGAGSNTTTIEVYRNGAVIFTAPAVFDYVFTRDEFNNVIATAAKYTHKIFISDSPPPGDYVYSLRLFSTNVSTVPAAQPKISDASMLIIAKK